VQRIKAGFDRRGVDHRNSVRENAAASQRFLDSFVAFLLSAGFFCSDSFVQARALTTTDASSRIGQLALFSTETGDAWLLDRTDFLAARLAGNGEAEPIQIVETAAHVCHRMEGQLSHQWPGVRLFGSGYRSRHYHPRIPNRQTRWRIARQRSTPLRRKKLKYVWLALVLLRHSFCSTAF
jgi:hypothetical protein